MAVLEDPLRLVIGDKAAKRLDSALGLQTVGDLLHHYPRRYDKRGELTELASLRDGEHVTVQAEIAAVTVRRMRNRPGTILEATVTDGRGRLTLTFFGRGRQDWREKVLRPGLHGLFSGQVSTFKGKRQLAHPEYELLGSGDGGARAEQYAAELIPVYPAGSQITSWQIADSVRIALDTLDVTGDPLPAGVRGRHGLCGYADALPFELTIGQQLAGATIADELALDHPMHRLLQGEVGSGKTVIAVRAMLQIVDAAGQAVL